MKCLVTGGAGFIGSHVADELISMGHDVVVLDDLSGGFAENVNAKAKFIEGDITDNELVKSLFSENKFDYVFHLAAYAAEGLSHFIKRFNYTNNLIGSVNLINASVNNKIKCFIFTSSIAVYGKNQVPLNEEMVPMPEDSYGIAKYAVELELKESHEMFGLNYVIFRPHNVYGERQNIGDKYRNVIGIFMNSIMQDKNLIVFGDGEQTRAFSYISDVSPIIAKSPFTKEACNEVFNIGADTPYTVNQLALQIGESFAVKPKVKHVPERNEVKNAYSSHEKLYRVFGRHKHVDLKEGIDRMAAWAKKAGPKKSKDFDDIEIMKNLPPSWL